MSILDRQKAFQMRIDEYNRKEDLAKAETYHSNREEKAINEAVSEVLGVKGNMVNINKKYGDWITSVKESLLFECVNKIFLEVFKGAKIGSNDPKYDNLKKSLVSSFVKSENVDSTINNMKYKSELLSEFALIINETMEKIKDKVNKNDENSYEIDTTVKDDFFSKLNMLNPDDVVGTIRTRVSDAIEEFITQNMADKADITDILQQAKERIDSSTDDAVKESYNMMAKKKINQIYDRPKNILGAMVYKLSEAAAINESVKTMYSNNDGTLDLDHIIETCEVLYTFMETMNTTKLMHFDENNIDDIIEVH